MRMRLILLSLLVAICADAQQVERYGRFEQTFTAAKDYGNPLKDVEITAEFSGPGNAKDVVRAFWDGGRKWKVRYSPEEPGAYTYKIHSSDKSDAVINEVTGRFTAANPKDNRLAGAPRLSYDRKYLITADNKPWFYLADTAWNGALLSSDEEWKRYLADRKSKRFTAIQFVLTPWLGAPKDENGQVAYTGTDAIQINPQFFDRMDRKIDAVNAAGLVAVPVMIWADSNAAFPDPGAALPASQVVLLAQYMNARYAGSNLIWMLAGGGKYDPGKWKGIGRAVFPAGRKRQLVGLQPQAMQDPWSDYKDEGWLDIFFFQSGQSGNAEKWRWNAKAGMNVEWTLEPFHPVIDSETNYEGHLSSTKAPIGEVAVRRAVYYSLLAGPTAGVAYGAHGIWSWERRPAVPLNHPGTGEARPWTECLNYPGAQQMKVMRDIFDSVEWWRLRPERYLVRYEDYDSTTFKGYIMSSLSEKGDIGMMYFPENASATLNLSRFEGAGKVVGTWADPRTGKKFPAGSWDKDPELKLKMPGPGDWVLLLQMSH